MISSPHFSGDVYMVLDRGTHCPQVGKKVYGDLYPTCNDAGQRTPNWFRIRNSQSCKKGPQDKEESLGK